MKNILVALACVFALVVSSAGVAKEAKKDAKGKKAPAAFCEKDGKKFGKAKTKEECEKQGGMWKEEAAMAKDAAKDAAKMPAAEPKTDAAAPAEAAPTGK